MDGPTIHFAPRQQRLSRLAPASAPPLLSVTALAGVPEFVRNRFGDKVVRAANRAARIDIEAIEDRDCFIPHATMTTFLSTVARRAGEPDLGLLLAPHLSLDAYGCWGRYVLDGADLHAAIARSMEAIGYHSRGDRCVLRLHGAQAQFCYVSAARGREGYAHVAVGAVGGMLSLCRAYLPASWRPLRIELDIPRPDRPSRFEAAFQCPVRSPPAGGRTADPLGQSPADAPRCRAGAARPLQPRRTCRRGRGPYPGAGAVREPVHRQHGAGT